MSHWGKVGDGLYVFQFPKFIKEKVDRLTRCDKIIEEAHEHKAEVELGNHFAGLVELLDVIHACESELRAGFQDGTYNDNLLKEAKLYVLMKNAKRGYYDDNTRNEIEFARILTRSE